MVDGVKSSRAVVAEFMEDFAQAIGDLQDLIEG